jgi:hypothetical protein
MNSRPARRPFSIVVGRIVIRLLIAAAVAWGALSAYRLFREHQRSNEIAPIHYFADQILQELRSGDFFGVQEKLIPSAQRVVSIDWISNFAKNAEINATSGSIWGKWHKVKDDNSSIYVLDGNISYITGKKNRMKWKVRVEGKRMDIKDLTLGRRSLVLVPKSPF